MSRFIPPYADVGKGITPSSGAKYFFFESNTSTPKNTYSDEALTIPNTNPVIADGNGLFPDIWLEPGQYKVRLTDKNDVQKHPDADPVESSAQAAETISVVDTIALLRSFEPLEDGQQVSLLGHTLAGIGGDIFYFDESDTTSADDNGTIIVTSGGKRWKRIIDDLVTPDMFGATYSDDDSLAFSGALSVGEIVSTIGRTINIDATSVGDIPDGVTIKDSLINITSGNFTLALSCHLSSCSVTGGGFNLTGGKTLTFDKLHFQDTPSNGILMNGNNKVRGSSLSGDNIGTNPSLSPPTEGHLVFGLNSLVDSECVIHGMFATNILGQGAIGTTRCRNFKIYDSIIDSVAFRAFSHFGDVADGLGSLGHEIINTTISRCGEIRTGSSGVGSNGIFSQTESNATGGVLEDLVVRGATITDVAENGFEGHGIFENITIKNTGAYPALTTPSKEGAFIQGNSSCKNINIYNANESGLVITPSADNLVIDGLYIDGYGQHGIESNNFNPTNYTRNNFVIKNVEIAQDPSDLALFDSVFIGDTSSGVTSYGGRSRIENISVAGNKLYKPTESGATKFVSTRLNSGLSITDEYSSLTTDSAAPTTGTHYLTDRIRNVLGITAGIDYEYVCVKSGTFESRSATNSTFSSGNSYFDSSTSTLVVGDVVDVPAGSDTVNNTIQRWTITNIVGDRHFVDRVIFGASTTATVPTASPAFETLVKT